MNNLPKHHGVKPPEAWGPIQLHRLHRLEARPALSPPMGTFGAIGWDEWDMKEV